jgi:hypothetical protein
MSGKNYLEIAERCQRYLASMALEGSPSKRYHVLLGQLRSKACRATPGSKSPHVHNKEAPIFVGAPSRYTTAQRQLQPDSLPPTEDVLEELSYRDVNSMGFSSDDVNMQVVGSNSEMEMLPASSASMMDFDALHLSWGYLDQLG